MILLKKANERVRYIIPHLKKLNLEYQIIDAVDKDELNEDYIERMISKEHVFAFYSRKKIASVLSRIKAFQAFLSQNSNYGFFIEDDVILPRFIKELLDEIEKEIKEDEVILLDYRTASIKYKIGLSKKDTKKLKFGMLVYPMQIDGIVGSGAYVVSKKFAEKFINLNREKIIPFSDSWSLFYEKGLFNSVRLFYPNVVEFKPFKSTFEYTKYKKIRNILSSFFLFDMILKLRRKIFINIVRKNFYFVDEKSPFIKMN